jgi:hypothetical protein
MFKFFIEVFSKPFCIDLFHKPINITNNITNYTKCEPE